MNDALNACRRLVVLSGAGISAESGVPTFRASDGLWENHRVEDVATPEAFERDPETVLRFYDMRRRHLLSGSVQANPGHRALAQIAQQWSGDLCVVTQNIDDLHERGGFTAPVHMHGELLKQRCASCDAVTVCETDQWPAQPCLHCGELALRPHVVWFGEMPLEMDAIEQVLSDCDVFVAVGTSGQVYPAANFVSIAKAAGAYCIEINTEDTSVSPQFDECWQGSASTQLETLSQCLLTPKAVND